MDVTEQVKAELTPTGKLRAAINMGNFLLVTGKDANGDPTGVSPDMAAEVARRLGVPLQLVPYATPGELGDDAEFRQVGYRKHRRGAATRGEDRVFGRVLRDRGDVSGAGWFADTDDRGRRQAGCAYFRDGARGLRALAAEQHQACGTGKDRLARFGLREIRFRQARRTWPGSGRGLSRMSRNCRAPAFSTVSSAPFSRRSARRRRTRKPHDGSLLSSKKQRLRAWSPASLKSITSKGFQWRRWFNDDWYSRAVPMKDDKPFRLPLWAFGLVRGIFFAVVWCAAMYLFRSKDQPLNIENTLVLAVLGGLLFGVSRAWMEARRRKSEDSA